MGWAKITTAADVEWSDGSKFQGILLLVFLPPVLSTGVYPFIYPRVAVGWRSLPLPLPKRLMLPITNGVVLDNRIFPQGMIDPPNVKLQDFWLDRAGALIATGAALFAITADGDYEITVPTLTVPTAETDQPTLTDLLQPIPGP